LPDRLAAFPRPLCHPTIIATGRPAYPSGVPRGTSYARQLVLATETFPCQ
jgi:hypothetical protein